MKRKLPEIFVTALLLLCAFFVGRAGGRLAEAAWQAGAQSGAGSLAGRRVVVDAGHGGNDPGKISVTGSNEKDINLAIALKLREKLSEWGCEVVMTRTTDTALCDDSTENKKQQDMKNRCKVIDEAGAALTVSIHQNSYTEESVKGPQVFYYESSLEAQEAARCIQDALNKELEIERPREIKANNTYYLLKRTASPTVIVECGFLSNYEEAGLLDTEEYQDQVAEAILEGIVGYLAISPA
ncbi:MAG TPA: N-acetylmuramoyl-L-alanine amidase [Candidatus Limivivens intestinipullorum]|uniref:N-acetylmuramoyl-L-alanine amidase n=1 Tax=Candidatus Limivivens intestinipullorum TaxID=2840858 RepID=A0A9D1EU37_9FIRM|nr:N-acetylmuramoyl-L-alanine amidase [Candidatus Limivivens intestinipullorum]